MSKSIEKECSVDSKRSSNTDRKSEQRKASSTINIRDLAQQAKQQIKDSKKKNAEERMWEYKI